MRKVILQWIHGLRCAAAAVAALSFMLNATAAMALTFGDVEKPVPQFSRSGEEITAKLIPRAKSTSVLIRFKAAGGRLGDVEGVDFEKVERPEVDVKNFKSALFSISVGDVPKGGEVRVSIISDFFTGSTAFYVFNAHLPVPWSDARAENIAHPDRIQELVVTVKDGGPRDSDGAADGRITLLGGPRDSFWGYALGTLFIRFFGIFIVLSILMLGMILSGFCFEYLERRKHRRPSVITESAESATTAQPQDAGAAPGRSADIPEADAAAIAAALHLHLSACQACPPLCLEVCRPSPWSQDGVCRIMGDRLTVFNRALKRKD